MSLSAFNEQAAANIDSVMNEIVQRGFVPGNALAIGIGGQLVYKKFFGYCEFEKKRPICEDTLYRMYSMTKPLTIVCAMQLWEQGKLSFEDPVSKFIPAFGKSNVQVLAKDGTYKIQPTDKQITIHQLMTMTSGIPYQGTDVAGNAMNNLGYAWQKVIDAGRPWNTIAAAEKIAQMPLAFEPGESYLYGLSHDILGAVIEVITGLNLGEYCTKYIFEPLGMKDSSFAIKERDRVATAYTLDGKGEIKETWGISVPSIDIIDFYHPVYFSGGAGLVSTLEDYYKFTRMLALGGTADGVRILGSRTVKLIATPQFDARLRHQYNTSDGDPMVCCESFSYGLGVRVMVEDRHKFSISGKGEWGWAGALGTWMSIDPADDMCFVYTHQRTNGPSVEYLPKLFAAIYSALD